MNIQRLHTNCVEIFPSLDLQLGASNSDKKKIDANFFFFKGAITFALVKQPLLFIFTFLESFWTLNASFRVINAARLGV